VNLWTVIDKNITANTKIMKTESQLPFDYFNSWFFIFPLVLAKLSFDKVFSEA
jgi:hypothetical protein